jgi:CheY-like chemotaxis protein
MAKKVLLVDDEVDFIEINKVALEGKGYEVIAAYSGKEALEKAEKEKPDIIVLDVMMSRQTEGFDTARELRKRKETETTPILMLTAVRERMDIHYKIGPDKDWLPITEFIEKPFPPEKLVDKINQMLQ